MAARATPLSFSNYAEHSRARVDNLRSKGSRYDRILVDLHLKPRAFMLHGPMR